MLTKLFRFSFKSFSVSQIDFLLGLLAFSFLLLNFWSCSNFNNYPGYKRTKSGIYFKLVEIGESSGKPEAGNYITVDLSYRTMGDSLFFSGRRQFRLEEPSYSGSVEECFSMLNIGDRAEFIIDAKNFFNITLETDLPFFLKGSELMKLSVKLLDIQTEESYMSEKEGFVNWIENSEMYEQFMLRQFIQEEQITVQPDSTGLYFINLKEGHGKIVETGDTLEIHYEGRFISGKVFDSTRKRNEPFQFIIGQKWQLVEGLERAIVMMREGEKALIILPSELAFGKYGSTTGIIPPYTSLLFEVEILRIR